MRSRFALALIGSGFAFLLLAWVFATPPFGAPDEQAHYLRAAEIANGSLLGPRAPATAPTALQRAFIAHDSRGVVISAVMAPPGSTCTDGKPVPIGGRCLVASYEGNFQPLPYLLPALAVKLSHRADRALWLGRLVSALPCLAFILLAFALLWSGSGWSVLGLFAAITPSTLFIESVINPNGLELAANLAFVAGLLRISRSPTVSPRWAWVATAGSGAVTILAWQLGWVFVGVEMLVFAALLGPESLRALWPHRRRELEATLGLLAAAAVVYVAYGLRADLLHSGFGIAPLGPGLRQGLVQLRTNLFGAISLFGLLDVSLPSDLYYWLWFALALGLLGGGVLLGAVRERTAALLTATIALLFPVLFFAWVQRHSGFGLQPRHVMPLLALIPLLGGELLFRHLGRVRAGLRNYLPAAVILGIACFQLFAWWINARTSAGEPARTWFLSHPAWSPPAGWAMWTASAAFGAALLAAFAGWDLRAGLRPPSPRNRSDYPARSPAAEAIGSPSANVRSSRHIARHTPSI